MLRHTCLSFVTVMLTAGVILAQVSQPSPLNPPTNGPRKTAPQSTVLIADHVHTAPGVAPIQAAIVIVDGEIQRVIPNPDGQDWTGARVFDLGDVHIYAGFIDAHQPVDVQAPDADSPGAHWSEHVMPQRRAADSSMLEESKKKSLRALGFTAAAIAPKGGIFAGRAAVVSLAPKADDRSDRRNDLYLADAYHALSLTSSGWGSRSYPTSQMGAISMLRQTLSDADYIAKHGDTTETAGCLVDLDELSELPLVFRTADELEVLRAAKIADEFKRPMMAIGSGTEFRRLDAIAALADRPGFAIVVPMTLPRKPDVSSVGRAESTNLRTLMTWEQAPTNPRRLHEAGVTIALTTSGLRDDESFSKNLTRALEVGLEAGDALAMLTTTPAEILGLDDELGTIEQGKRANLVIATGDLFDAKARSAKKNAPRVLDVWIDGQRTVVSQPEPPSLDGTWLFAIGEFFQMDMAIDGDSIKLTETNEAGDATTTKARKVSRGPDGTISFYYDNPDKSEQDSVYILSGILTPDGTIAGTGIHPSGRTFNWIGTTKPSDDETDEDQDDAPDKDAFAGTWDALLSGQFELSVKITKDKDDWSAVISEAKPDGTTIRQNAESATLDGDQLTIVFEHEPFGQAGIFTLVAKVQDEDTLTGTGTTPGGQAFDWIAARGSDIQLPPEELPGYPFGAYASAELPAQNAVLFRSATIWTQTDEGIIDEGDLLIVDGKIVYVGPSKAWSFTPSNEPRIIDSRGKHITPGLIDAHSHTGISRGVNEAGQAVTAEVRIADVTNPDSINWYRQLAGGVTTVNNLHGSANPIGGQSQTNKVRWGVTRPDDMHFANAKPGIKFALGENVKQSNWGSEYTTRYPQTRMGVETIMRDRFNAAREYAAKGNDVRRDLELEALVEILEGDRLIHCHSYRQDEILMLCDIADDYDFKIGTFQHGLEVYKVAEHVREHAIGSSIFSDWWAYKVEVQDAIPYAGPLQSEAGVLTSFNSDSDELARRMNAEAAKAFKYADGRLTKQQALAFVTINPAIQLGIDSTVGSLEAGKDADLAIWSRDPLNNFTRCIATYIDGREYFSKQRDLELREANAAHRTRIIQKLLGEPSDKPKVVAADDNKDEAEKEPELAFDPAADSLRDATLNLIRLGKQPADHACGDCGTSHLHLSNLIGDQH